MPIPHLSIFQSPAKKAVKASQKEFVERLASYADCYINDAFGTAHRAHASTALIADKFPHDKNPRLPFPDEVIELLAAEDLP